MTDVIRIDTVVHDPVRLAAALAEPAACLRRGGLVAFPTETVYGLGAHALDRTAVRRIFDAKGRPGSDPLIVHAASLDAIRPLVTTLPARLDGLVQRLAARFWPGPLTLVLPRAPVVPDEVTAGLDTVAVRVPAHPVALALLRAAGVPVAAPSANLFSRPSPTRAAHVLEDLDGRFDILVDGGSTTVGVESTVLDLSGPTATILRPGAVTLEMLRDLVPDVRLADGPAAAHGTALPSPGLLERHYSPRAPLTVYDGDPVVAVRQLCTDAAREAGRGRTVGVLLADEDQAPEDAARIRVIRLGGADDAAAVAAGLYAALRTFDAQGVEIIMARAFGGQHGLGPAIRDRLRRAAAGKVIRCEAGGAPAPSHP
jgi:L-threonylcarbamoyladenylate synthase